MRELISGADVNKITKESIAELRAKMSVRILEAGDRTGTYKRGDEDDGGTPGGSSTQDDDVEVILAHVLTDIKKNSEEGKHASDRDT